MNCLHCDTPLPVSTTKPIKFCSPKCKTAFRRVVKRIIARIECEPGATGPISSEPLSGVRIGNEAAQGGEGKS